MAPPSGLGGAIYGADPVSTTADATQIMLSSVVVMLANNPRPPAGGTAREIDTVVGGTVIGMGCAVIMGIMLLWEFPHRFILAGAKLSNVISTVSVSVTES